MKKILSQNKLFLKKNRIKVNQKQHNQIVKLKLTPGINTLGIFQSNHNHCQTHEKKHNANGSDQANNCLLCARIKRTYRLQHLWIVHK